MQEQVSQTQIIVRHGLVRPDTLYGMDLTSGQKSSLADEVEEGKYVVMPLQKVPFTVQKDKVELYILLRNQGDFGGMTLFSDSFSE